MSRMLNLAATLLANGQNYHALGRRQDAVRILKRLAGFGELPAEVAEMTQASLAEIYLERGMYRRARRHLSAVLRLRPDCARYHYQMATALDADEEPDLKRAARHYRKSLELDPDQPQCLSDYGLLALDEGKFDEGLQHLRRAVELAPEDPETLGTLATGMRMADRSEEARAVLRAALFRHPRDLRFRKLWNDFQFEELRQRQQEEKHTRYATAGQIDDPDLLPFVRPAPSPTAQLEDGKRIRRDVAEPMPPPHSPRPMRRRNERHA